MRHERLIAELNADVELLGELCEKNRRAGARIEAGATDELDWAALGYTIHNLYNALEAYFLRVAKFFENDLPSSAWHRELLTRMTLSIEGVRPALLSKELSRTIDELRSFRHVFRNIYDGALDPERVRLVQARVAPALSAFVEAHQAYVDKLRTIADLAEE
jgi:hypothetical protein